MNRINLYGCLLLTLGFSFFSCEKDDVTLVESNNKVVNFVDDCMQTYYLWNKEIPVLDLKKETNPYLYLEKIRYADDEWSVLTDDVASFYSSLSGTESTFGYSLALGTFVDNPNNVFAAILFTYPNSPAEKAGLKRGDFIVGINGNRITLDNYTDLFYAPSIHVDLAYLVDETLHQSGKSVQLTAKTMYLDPVNIYKIIEIEDHKIGYLFYTDFLLQSHESLQSVFDYFKQNEVTDVVLDLRYNLGGYATTCDLFGSILAPASALSQEAVFTKNVWNDEWMKYFESEGYDPDSYFTSVLTYYDDNDRKIQETIRSNMDLSRLYVITGMNTASASECLINGLKPYMDVITIGETTAGKFCSGTVFTIDQIYKNPASEIDNWGLYAMISRFADKNGETHCINGYQPDYSMDDIFYGENSELGDESEYLLAKAISLITGNPILSPRSDKGGVIRPFIPIPGLKTRSNDFRGKMISKVRF